MNTVFLLSLGCPKNLVDGEKLIESLSNFKIVATPDMAEIIIINTCSFIKSATEETIDAILEASKYKQSGKCEKLIITGCLAGRYSIDELKKSLLEVDLFLKPYETDKIFEFLKTKKYQHHNVCHSTHNLTPKHRAYVKIADGCCNNCAYCTIPMIRGKYKSTPTKKIVNEVKELFESGVKEITLVAQDTSSYGIDLGPNTNLLSLLKKLKPLTNKNSWIRILYSQPKPILYDVADFISSNEGFAPYLDVPIQHISKKMLKSMNRNIKTEEIIRKLKTKNIYLRTTVMTGFPGETKKDFEELFSFLREIKFDHLGAFVFSPEEETKAFKMNKKVSNKIAQARLDSIMTLQAEISHKKLQKIVGQKLQILVDGINDDGKIFGRHIGQAPEIDGAVILKDEETKYGSFINSKIVKTSGDYDLSCQL